MPSVLAKSKIRKKKYTKLLNNLLEIRGNDQTVFTRVRGTDSFDITSKFGKQYAKKILSQKSFNLKLREQDLEKLLELIQKATTAEEIINGYNECKERIFNTTKLLLQDKTKFNETKANLIQTIKSKIQKCNTRWNIFRRKVIDINTEHNVWPLHVATCFISLATENKTIYSPLLLKEVNIKIDGSQIIINSESSWKINEKLIFLLDEAGYKINKEFNIEELTAPAIFDFIAKQFNVSLEYINFYDQFKNKKRNDIINKELKFYPGVVLGIFKPSGGYLRKAMKQIIERNEIDNVIDVEPDKRIYKENLEDFIKNDYQKLVKIQPSNFSQDKALASAMIQNTIIWGPPGTGKSQVIANIIANVLYQNKKAVVLSEKKVALDVLRSRLGKVAPFALFILNDNKLIKKEFYKPLQEFIDMVENLEIIREKDQSELITEKQIKALKIIFESKKNKSYYSSMQIIEKLQGNSNYIETYFNIDPTLNYLNPKGLKINKYKKLLAQENNVKKLLFFFYQKKFKEACKAAFNLLKINELDIDINKLKKLIHNTNYITIKNLLTVPQALQRSEKYKSDENYLVAILSKNIIDQINNWKQSNRDLYNQYKKFANAIRAGRRLPYKFVNDHVNIIREIFPVIITTPETVFINWEKEEFDYAILDESSQIFLEVGLPTIYLAEIKVLAGDMQQMQPSRWFLTRDDDEEEEDVPENAESVLDYAFDKGVYQIMLNQNYRSSAAALMAFSSKNFYNSKLEVIDKLIRKNQCPISVINVNGKWDKGVNLVEARKVIDIAHDNLGYYEKIIILTFNSPQRQLIEKMILENHPKLSKAIEQEQLTVKNIENIQGNEADLVIASVVYDSSTYTQSTYVARYGGKNALNVAISRAKEKMIVIKSVTANTIKAANSKDFEIFRSWLSFLDMSQDQQKNYANQEEYSIEESYGDTESEFEKEVVDTLIKNLTSSSRLKLIKQYSVGSRRIDIAIVNEKNDYIIGIEVDGYKYHGGLGWEKYLEDYSRQEFLEIKGYDIFRIQEIDWKINKSKVLSNIKFLIEKKLNLKSEF